MGKMDSVRRIRAEDYPEDSQDVIAALAPVLNSFMEQVVNILDGNVDYDNLRKDLVSVDVTTVSGVPTTATKVRFSITGRIAGTDVIKAQNLTSTVAYPTAQPFITYTTVGDLMTITHISGLPDNTKFRLTVEVKGK